MKIKIKKSQKLNGKLEVRICDWFIYFYIKREIINSFVKAGIKTCVIYIIQKKKSSEVMKFANFTKLQRRTRR